MRVEYIGIYAKLAHPDCMLVTTEECSKHVPHDSKVTPPTRALKFFVLCRSIVTFAFYILSIYAREQVVKH